MEKKKAKKEATTELKKVKIDIDIIIEKYNLKNPDKLQLTRKILADRYGKNVQLFSDWKRGITPEAAAILFDLCDLGKCQFSDFVTKQD